MGYHLFRLSLSKRDVSAFLPGLEPPDETRTDFLRRVFSERRDFKYWGRDYTYVFLLEEDEVLVSRVGRAGTFAAADGPETGFAPTERVGHAAVNVLLDINDKQQILAIQADSTVGSPASIATGLVNYINDNFVARWAIDVGTINDPQTFWEVVAKHRGEITNITFHFIAPNVLGLGKSTDKDMKTVRDKLNGRTATVAIKNPDGGLNLDTDEIKDGVEYATKGAGDVTLKKGKVKLYSSKERIKKVRVPQDEALSKEADISGFIARVRHAIFGR